MGVMWISLVAQTAVRIPAAYLIAYLTRSEKHPAGDPRSCFWALVLTVFCIAAATLIYYRAGRWKTKGITAKAKAAQAEL